jgi:phosphoglycolate phosphatase-like HAD superfamily hydrolase
MPLSPANSATGADPLASWNEGPTKALIVDFVARVTQAGGADFVTPEERVAVFDNDGTLWSEYPYPFQVAFALDQVKAMAAQHPEWQGEEPFKSVLAGDMAGVFAAGVPGLLKIVAATHSGMATEDFDRTAHDWLATARHPKTGKLFTEMVFQPMLELLAYLRANGFKTFIVSGGGIEFMRAFAEIAYGVPPEQVIGSSGKLKFEMRDDVPVLTKLGDIALVDDNVEKPCAIQNHIGRRPIAAFGNSDGDHEMLQWTAAGPGARLALLVHHTDADREFAYEKGAAGVLDKALIEARAKSWAVVDMKTDWGRVFAFEEPPAATTAEQRTLQPRDWKLQ